MRARHLTVAAALLLLIGAGQTLGGEPTAAGLWQSLDEDSHQPNAWFLIRDNGGLYEGTIVRMFMKPGEDPNVVCDKCKDDRRGKPWLGLDIIRGMKRNGAEYTNGTILDPRDGDLYSAMMTLSPDRPQASHVNSAFYRGGSDHRRFPAAYAAVARRLPLRTAADHPTSHAVIPAPLPQATRHQPIAGDRRQ